MDLSGLGQRIKFLRESRQWSLEELAHSSDVAKNTINDLENGKGNPTLKTIELISQALGERLIEFYPPKPTKKQMAAMVRFSSLAAHADLVTLHACLYLWRGSKENLELVHSKIRDEVYALRKHIDLIRSENE